MFKKIKIVFIILAALLIMISPLLTKKSYAENPDSVVKYTFGDSDEVVIPRLIRLEKLSEDCFKITYSEKAELKQALDTNNYWIQNLMEKEPKDGIASLGKKEKICKENSLSKDNVTITKEDDDGRVFILKFNKNIPSGTKYKMSIHSISVSGAKPYTGSNGALNITT